MHHDVEYHRKTVSAMDARFFLSSYSTVPLKSALVSSHDRLETFNALQNGLNSCSNIIRTLLQPDTRWQSSCCEAV